MKPQPLSRPACRGTLWKLSTTLCAICLVSALPAHANPTRCQIGELTRTVEVVYSNPGQPVPCEVLYNKSDEGTLQTLWRAFNEAGYCEEQAEGLIDKLESLGWACEAAAVDPQ